jgi:ABC-2 type transport system permease protein
MSDSRGVVFDLGYQPYTGPREGRARARRALWLNGLRTSLGLGRGSRAKILPILFFVAVVAPAIVLALVASQFEGPMVDALDLPGHAGYYRIISVILLLFSAIIAPELLCPDRRDGVLQLYLVRPLTTTDYVIGRWLAFFSITLAIVYAGQIVLLIGLVLAAAEPLTYLRETWLDIPRFLAAGLAVAVFTTTLPLAVSAFTSRRAYAAAFVIGFYIISAPVAGILTECQSGHGEFGPGAQIVDGEIAQCEPLGGEGARWFALIDIGLVPIHVSDLIFGEEDQSSTSVLVRQLPAIVPVGWYLILTIIPGWALLWRYRNMRL